MDGGQHDLRKHSSYRVSTGQIPAQPPPPETIVLRLLLGIEGSHPSEHHDGRAGKNGRCLDRGF